LLGREKASAKRGELEKRGFHATSEHNFSLSGATLSSDKSVGTAPGVIRAEEASNSLLHLFKCEMGRKMRPLAHSFLGAEIHTNYQLARSFSDPEGRSWRGE